MSREPAINLIYCPVILPNMAAIRERFGVGERTVKTWVEAGAPISVEGEGMKTRYSAEVMRLQIWREEQAEKSRPK